MERNQDSQQDALKLVVKILDGVASPEEVDRLQSAIRADSVCRDSVARFLVDESFLSDEFRPIKDVASLVQLDAAERSRVLSELSAAPAGGAGGPMGRRAGWPAYAVALACLLLAGVSVGLFSSTKAPEPGGASLSADASPEPDEAAAPAAVVAEAAWVAQVTSIDRARWPKGSRSIAVGDRLVAGDVLRLKGGAVQLSFERGVRMIAQAPMELEISSEVECRLSAGKASVRVPRAAKGFTVHTPVMELVDLGAEFGVSVEDSGASEVHVFTGDVLVRSNAAGVADDVLVQAGVGAQAYRITPASLRATGIELNRRQFRARVEPLFARDTLPPLPVKEGLTLWLAADCLTPEGEQERVGLWPDLTVGDNKYPDDALQLEKHYQPKLIHDDRGVPAVRFNGWSSSLATGPMETTDDMTVFAVVCPDRTLLEKNALGEMVLKVGSIEPTLELVLLTGRKPRAQVWAGSKGFRALREGETHFGQVTSGPAGLRTPVILSYDYRHSEDRSELFVNGASQGTAGARFPMKQLDKCYIGMHPAPHYKMCFLGHYRGEIYEIIVYNRGLTEQQRDAVTRYLSVRSNVAID